MKKVHFQNRFKRDFKRIIKRGKDRQKLEVIVDLLRTDMELPSRTRAHKLEGEWKGFWECHVEPDWLLIYDVTDTEVFLAATGTHADLFR